MKRLALLLLPLAVFLSGFKYLDPPRRWTQFPDPIEYYVGNNTAGNLSVDGIDRDEAVELIDASFAQWENARCSPIETVDRGDVNNIPDFEPGDGITTLMFQGSLESGVLAATIPYTAGAGGSFNGVNFQRMEQMDVVYNSGITWGTPADISDPACRGRTSFLGVSTHEIGHGIGFGHSCDQEDSCPDPILRGATMYWSVGPCNDGQDIIGEDDVAAVNAHYGVSVDFDVQFQDGSATGTVPYTVVVQVGSGFTSDRYVEYEWNFGDGSDRVVQVNDGSPAALEHTYEREGQFTITLTARVEDDDCGGEVETQRRQVGVVLACGEPAPSFDWQALGGLEVQVRNRSTIDAFGCVTDFEWVVDGDEANALRTYEPTLTFDEPGEHTVVLRASGIGGTTEFEDTVVAQRAEPSVATCAAAGGGGVLAGLLALLGLAPRRRR